MAYTFSTQPDGNVQVSQNGTVVSTGTAQNASMNYGYVPITPNAPKPAAEVGVVSSAQGADTINQKTKQLSSLTPAPVVVDTTKVGPGSPGYKASEDSVPQSATKITLINPDTGQTSVFDNADINKGNIQALMGSGYKISETSGDLPSWLVANSTGTSTTPQSKAQAEVDQASTDLKSLTDNLSRYTISDEQLKGQIEAITAQWNARIEDMKKVNTSRTGNINTTGIRLGSQFAGGSGGVFGGIVSEEERQGVVRIGELEANKQSAISAARSAAQQQNWQVYSKQVDLAQKAYDSKIEALKELNKATLDQNKLISDNIKDAAKTHYDQITKPINDIVTSLGKSSSPVPPELIDAVSNAGSLAEAVKLAGKYLQDVPTTGIVGEYLFYKREAEAKGTTPVDFNTYQNIDANRKARATAIANGGGLTSGENSTYLTITNKYQADPIINNAIKAQQTIDMADAIIKNPSSATNQLSALYAFVKALDPDSAVREGEISLANQTQSYLQKYETSLTRLSKGQVISPDSAVELAKATKSLASNWQKSATAKERLYTAQANGSSPKVGEVFAKYLKDTKATPSTADQIHQTEAEAETKLKDIVADPAKAPEVNTKISAMEKSLGRPISAADFLQAFPEYNQ